MEKIKFILLLVVLVRATSLLLAQDGDAKSSYESVKQKKILAVSDRGNNNITSQIGHPITVGEYCEFLNAVAASDFHHLYNNNIENSIEVYIHRSGEPGSYFYSTLQGKENTPIDGISWNNAARYCNWIMNEKQTGEKFSNSIEYGAYELQDDQVVAVNPGAIFIVVSTAELLAFQASSSFPTNTVSVETKYDELLGSNNGEFHILNTYAVTALSNKSSGPGSKDQSWKQKLTGFVEVIGMLAGGREVADTHALKLDDFKHAASICSDKARFIIIEEGGRPSIISQEACLTNHDKNRKENRDIFNALGVAINNEYITKTGKPLYQNQPVMPIEFFDIPLTCNRLRQVLSKNDEMIIRTIKLSKEKSPIHKLSENKAQCFSNMQEDETEEIDCNGNVLNRKDKKTSNPILSVSNNAEVDSSSEGKFDVFNSTTVVNDLGSTTKSFFVKNFSSSLSRLGYYIFEGLLLKMQKKTTFASVTSAMSDTTTRIRHLSAHAKNDPFDKIRTEDVIAPNGDIIKQDVMKNDQLLVTLPEGYTSETFINKLNDLDLNNVASLTQVDKDASIYLLSFKTSSLSLWQDRLQKIRQISGANPQPNFVYLPSLPTIPKKDVLTDKKTDVSNANQESSYTNEEKFSSSNLVVDGSVNIDNTEKIKGIYKNPNQWNLYDNRGIKAPEAWKICTDASSVKVGVIDSGINYKHDNLSANMPGETHGLFFYEQNGEQQTSTDVMDANGHGTHVAGIIGASGHDGIRGIAWKANILAYKCIDTGLSTEMDQIRSIYQACKDEVSILNCSFGRGILRKFIYGYEPDAYFLQALTYAKNKGVIVVISAGNEAVNLDNPVPVYGNTKYPLPFFLPAFRSLYDNVIIVASSQKNSDDLSSFSNYGSTNVDIAAPGEEILSTWCQNMGSSEKNYPYHTISGTSMAAPHVTGALALMKAHFKGKTYNWLIDKLLNSADKIEKLAGKVAGSTNYGRRLNLAAALEAGNTKIITPNLVQLWQEIAEQLEKAVAAGVNKKPLIAEHWSDIAQKNQLGIQYFSRAASTLNKEESTGWNNAGNAMYYATEKLAKAIRAEEAANTNIPQKLRTAAELQLKSIEFYIKGAMAITITEGNSWNNAGDGYYFTAEKLAKAIEAETADKIDSAEKYYEAAELQKKSISNYTTAAKTMSEGKTTESQSWNDAGNSIYQAADKLVKVIKFKEAGNTEIAEQYSKVAEIQQSSAELFIKAAEARSNNETRDQGNSWHHAGNSIYQAADKLVKAIEAKEAGNTKIAEQYRKVAEIQQSSAELFIKAAEEKPKEKTVIARPLSQQTEVQLNHAYLGAVQELWLSFSEIIRTGLTWQKIYNVVGQKTNGSASESATHSAQITLSKDEQNERLQTDKGNSWHDAGSAMYFSAEKLVKAIETAEEGKQAVSDKYSKASSLQKQSAESFEQASMTLDNKDPARGTSWNNAGLTLYESGDNIAKAIAMENNSKPTAAEKYYKTALLHQQSAFYYNQAARAYAVQNTNRGKNLDTRGENCSKEASLALNKAIAAERAPEFKRSWWMRNLGLIAVISASAIQYKYSGCSLLLNEVHARGWQPVCNQWEGLFNNSFEERKLFFPPHSWQMFLMPHFEICNNNVYSIDQIDTDLIDAAQSTSRLLIEKTTEAKLASLWKVADTYSKASDLQQQIVKLIQTAQIHIVDKTDGGTSWTSIFKWLSAAGGFYWVANKLGKVIEPDPAIAEKYCEATALRKKSIEHDTQANIANSKGKTDEGIYWKNVADGFCAAANTLEKAIKAEKETAEKYSEAATLHQESNQYYTMAAIADSENKKTEGIYWNKAGLSFYNAAKNLVNAIEAEEAGKQKVAQLYREAAVLNKQSGELCIVVARAYKPEKQDEGKSWYNAGNGFYDAAENLVNAIEAEVAGKPEVAQLHREAAVWAKQSVEPFTQSAKAHSAEKTTEATYWNNAGCGFYNAAINLVNAIEAEVAGKPEVAQLYRETALLQWKSVEPFTQSAKAHSAGKTTECVGLEKSGFCFLNASKKLKKAIESEEDNKHELAATYREAASLLQQSNEYFTQAARAKLKRNASICWENAGDSCAKTVLKLDQAIKADNKANNKKYLTVEPIHWWYRLTALFGGHGSVQKDHEDAICFLKAIKFFTQAARAYEQGNDEEGVTLNNKGMQLHKQTIQK